MGEVNVDWDVVSEVASSCGIDRSVVAKIIHLFRSGNTVPFIARYRKEITGNLDPDSLRSIKAKLTQCR